MPTAAKTTTAVLPAINGTSHFGRLRSGGRGTSNSVTGKVDAKDGVHSPTVTVHETGTYYWREKVYDQTGKLISYGDARKSNETVLVKEKGLASTGVGTPMLLWAGVLAGAGIALALAGSRKRIRL